MQRYPGYKYLFRKICFTKKHYLFSNKEGVERGLRPIHGIKLQRPQNTVDRDSALWRGVAAET